MTDLEQLRYPIGKAPRVAELDAATRRHMIDSSPTRRRAIDRSSPACPTRSSIRRTGRTAGLFARCSSRARQPHERVHPDEARGH